MDYPLGGLGGSHASPALAPVARGRLRARLVGPARSARSGARSADQGKRHREARAAHLRHPGRQRRSRPQRRHRRRRARNAGDRSGAGSPERGDGPARGGQGQQERRAVHRLDALPSRTHDRLQRLPRFCPVHQLHRAGGRVRAERHADGANVLGPVGSDGRAAQGRGAPAGDNDIRPRVLARFSAEFASASPSSGRPTREATRRSSSTATTSSSPATSS